MKGIICLVALFGVMALANDIDNPYGTAPGTPPPTPTFLPDSMWTQVNTCPLQSAEVQMGIWYDNGTLWHLVNTTGQPFTVLRYDTLGTALSQFSSTGAAYGVGLCRVGDSIFIASFYPTPEQIYVYDTAGNYGRSFQLSSGGRCRGIDYDANTNSFWVFGSTGTMVNVYICNRTGTVRKTIPISGTYWNFQGVIDRKYYPGRIWEGDQQGMMHMYCAVDTVTNSGSVLFQGANPGSSYPEGTCYEAGAGGVGYCWVTSVYTATAWKMQVHDVGGVSVGEGTSARLEKGLFRITPNPARGNVVFSLPKHETAKVTVYNASGEKVASLTGRDQIVWKNNLPAGVYFCETETSGAKETRNLIIVK